jgi:hypothetical protein
VRPKSTMHLGSMKMKLKSPKTSLTILSWLERLTICTFYDSRLIDRVSLCLDRFPILYHLSSSVAREIICKKTFLGADPHSPHVQLITSYIEAYHNPKFAVKDLFGAIPRVEHWRCWGNFHVLARQYMIAILARHYLDNRFPLQQIVGFSFVNLPILNLFPHLQRRRRLFLSKCNK